MSNDAAVAPRKLATWSWALWGWAEHAYPTIIQTFIFATYITSDAFGKNTDALSNQFGLAVSLAGLAVAVSAPVIGRRSDASGRRKRSLLINSGILIALMFASYFVMPSPAYFGFGLALYAIGSVVQEITFVNYYAMLKQVSTPKTMARVSGLAWGLGYVGGIVLLLIALVGFYLPDHPWFGISTDGAQNIRFMFVISAVWMLVFSIPMALFVPEVAAPANAKKVSILESYRGLWSQLKSLRQTSPDALRFLIASAIFRDGLVGVFTFGAVLGSVAFGFTKTQVIFYGIAASIVAGIGATIGGFVDERIGTKKTIQGSLIGLVLAGLSVFVFAGAGPITYWIGGLSLSLFVGPAQASARTFLARLAPKHREGELFGLYQTTGEAASFLAPTLWSICISLATAAGVAHPTIFGVLGIVAILAVGIWLMSRVHPNPRVAE
jgi:UMF1 family MFS transporter